MSDQEKDQGIKIVDKRRFSDEGVEREESSPSSSKGGTAAGPAERSAQAGTVQSSAKPSATKAAPSAEEGGQRRAGGAAAVNFINFVLGLGTQVLVLLGEIPNPETGLVSANLSAAKQTIDILGMLEEKTKGNLDEQEATLFTEVLSSLRLAFADRVNSKA